MGNEIIDLLLRLNVALAAGVALVLVLRWPVRHWFGARVAYALWLIPLAAALICFAPGRVETIVLDVSEAASADASPSVVPTYAWTWAWAFGALVSLSILTIRQARFTQSLGRLGVREDLGKRVCAAQSIEHGPAVVGVIRPVIVTPADFDARFDAEERRLVLAHTAIRGSTRSCSRCNASTGSILSCMSERGSCASTRSWHATRPCWPGPKAGGGATPKRC